MAELKIQDSIIGINANINKNISNDIISDEQSIYLLTSNP